MPIPATSLLLLAAIVSMECTVFETPEPQECSPAVATSFDALSAQKDTSTREPFLDPLSLFSDKVYLVRPVAQDKETITNAEFKGGEEAMVHYIRTNVLEHIAPGIGWLKHPIVHFTINEQGMAERVELVRSSDDAELDTVLIGIFSAMPAWKPATNAQHRPVAQSFAFTTLPGGC